MPLRAMTPARTSRMPRKKAIASAEEAPVGRCPRDYLSFAEARWDGANAILKRRLRIRTVRVGGVWVFRIECS
jgi:hypothetical protein